MNLEGYEFLILEDIDIPPYSNTGVTNRQNAEKYHIRYDWFEGLITWSDGLSYYEHIGEILTNLDIGFDHVHDTRILGLYLPNKKKVSRGQNWQHAIAFMSGEIPLITISYGGPNAQYGDYFVITGESAHLIVDTLRRYFMGMCRGELAHNQLSVKRVDVAIDVRGDFDFMVDRMMPVIAKHDLTISNQGNWLTPNHKGRTLYLQKTKTVEMRVYEKGHQMRNVFGVEDAPLDWVRFELQVRVPKGKNSKIMKKALASANAFEIFHSFEFAVDCFASVSGLDLDYTPIQYTTKSEKLPIERLLEVINVQYGEKLRNLIETREGFEMLMESFYPDSNDIPYHLRKNCPVFISHENFLNTGGE